MKNFSRVTAGMLAWALALTLAQSTVPVASSAATAPSSCGIPNISVSQTKIAPGAFNPANTSLSHCISSTAAALNANSSGKGIYNVKRSPYGAKCNGSADDTRAIQNAEHAAAAAGGGTVYIPAGRCIISTGIAWDSHVNLVGAGMFRTTLAASPDFSFDPKNVRIGPDGRYIGMIWLDGPAQTSPLSDVTISDIGLDPRAGTQGRRYGQFNYQAISSYMRALQHVAFKNIYFNLGYNTQNYIGKSDGPKGFTGFELKLATDCDNPTEGVSFNNIVGHNGYGTIQIYASDPPKLHCPSMTHMRNISINGVADFVDGLYIDDDRVVVDGSGVQPSEASNITIKNLQAFAFDGISGGINGLKINTGPKGTLHGITIEGLRFRGPAVGVYTPPLYARHAMGSGSPAAILSNDSPDGAVNDVTIDDVKATNSMDMPVHVKATPVSGSTIKLHLSNVSLLHCYSLGAAITVGVWSPPTGSDVVHIANVTMQAAPEALAQTPTIYGMLVRGRAPEHGASGDISISNVSIHGYPAPMVVGAAGRFSRVNVAHVHADRGTVRVPRDANVTP